MPWWPVTCTLSVATLTDDAAEVRALYAELRKRLDPDHWTVSNSEGRGRIRLEGTFPDFREKGGAPLTSKPYATMLIAQEFAEAAEGLPLGPLTLDVYGGGMAA